MYMKTIVAAVLLIGSSLAALAGGNTNETPAQRDSRLAWWREGRFGMFIHWGPVSLTGQEISWSRANSNPKCPNNGATPIEVYDNLYKHFNPTNFDASEWARTAKSAGMKYMVLTAKHCDGFLLWNSKVDPYNISSTPFHRDVCAELARSAHRAGLRIGWYFSPVDWRDPDCRTERNSIYLTRMQGELREVLSNFGTIDLLWFDWDSREALYEQPTTYQIVGEMQPGIIINNRLDLAAGDNDNMIKSPWADYYTPEQRIGHYDYQQPWETCMTLGTQWAWKPNDKIKSAKEVIEILARTVGGDGNLLLNVGPMPDGRIEPRQAEVLKMVGEWLQKNGKSIYGTRGGPFKPGDYGASTRKGKTVFIHMLKWPNSPVQFPPIPAKILRAELLTARKAEFSQTEKQIGIFVPPGDRDANDTVVALTLDKETASIATTQAGDSIYPFFPFCIDWHDAKKRSFKEQAEMLKDLGYDGVGHIWLDKVAERLQTLDESGLKLFQITMTVDVGPAKNPYDARFKDVLQIVKGRHVQFDLIVNGGKASDTALDQQAVIILRELSELARDTDAQLLLYPHQGSWIERMEDAIRVADKVDRRNVGVMFNLCHWLRVNEARDYKPLLVKAMPRLWAVSINGADEYDPKPGWEHYIQPLDKGSFDLATMLKTLKEVGYRGPIGLQCYGIGGDGREHLARSMAAWKKLRVNLQE
jgi:alpha-L-fucosidase